MSSADGMLCGEPSTPFCRRSIDAFDLSGTPKPEGLEAEGAATSESAGKEESKGDVGEMDAAGDASRTLPSGGAAAGAYFWSRSMFVAMKGGS